MARRALGPATMAVVTALSSAVEGLGETGLLVACSGGADSLALLGGAAELARRGRPVRCATVDHGLQPGSAERAAEVAAVSADLGVPCDVLAVTVEQTAAGLEADARTARYAALDRAALAGDPDAAVPTYGPQGRRGDIPSAQSQAVDWNRASGQEPATVLLGHTLDDQAETVLLGLARGSGARSLSGMAARRTSGAGVTHLRPLLGLRRADTEAACAELGLQPWHDPMNDDPTYARVRARRTVLPTLENQLGPGIAVALARTAEMLREDADALDDLAGPDHFVGPELDVDDLDHRPALRRRQLRAWLQANGAVEPSRRHILAVEAMVTDWRGQKAVDVPRVRVVRRAQRLVVVTD